ncbi:uncharacterized protein LOC141665184 [Apium graveolens]|uniref:uncharacterized protein LOC141665184 n=1 Tax=Apium graveolens TaxID=4045 RepID=UPI003D7B9A45
MPSQLHPIAATTTAIIVHRTAAKPLPPPPENTTSPKLTTTLYQTPIGLFALTWSKNVLTHSLHIHFTSHDVVSDQTFHSFNLHLKPFLFWKKHGSRKLAVKNTRIFWDFSNAKFGSRPEPQSGFYIAILSHGETILLIGDLSKQAYSKTKTSNACPPSNPLLKREHVFGTNKVYATKATFGNKTRNILIDCRLLGDKTSLVLTIDNKRVLRVKHLKWKFRGNERIEVDGIQVQISWDVHDWLFDHQNEKEGHALFMFKFEKLGVHEDDDLGLWTQQQSCGIKYEAKKLKKGVLTSSRSSCSSSSLSSASSNSVMEWESIEENELKVPSGFSLLLYAWKN